MSDKIFDLEQQIMNAWNVVDDIDMLYTYFGDDPMFAGLDAKAEDEMMNLLLGVKSLYALKFEKLFHTFEEVTREYHIRGKKVEELQEQVRILSNERESFDTEDDYLIREYQQIQNTQDFIDDEMKEREDKARRRSSIDDATPEEWNNAFRTAWNENRIDIIGQNGNDGLHYPADFAGKHDE